MKGANIVLSGTTVYLARTWGSVTIEGGQNAQIYNPPIFQGFKWITDIKSDASWTHKCIPSLSSNTDLESLSHIRGPSYSGLLQPHVWPHPTCNPHCSHTKPTFSSFLLPNLRPHKASSQERLLPAPVCVMNPSPQHAGSCSPAPLVSIPRQSWRSHCWALP